MYLSLGPNTILSYGEIVGIFDLDNVSQSYRTRQFLDRAEQEGELNTVGEDIPKSLVVCAPPWGGQRLFLAQLSPTTLRGRIEHNSLFEKEREHTP
jgi:hypothetical protein